MNYRLNTEVLLEDPDILAVDKPAGVLTIPDRFDLAAPNLADMARERCGEIFIVHRLDRDTSGVLLFAKTADAHKALNTQFEEHTVEKEYEAVVDGVVREDEGTIDLPLAPHPKLKGLMRVDHANGKPSVTRYVVRERFRDFTHLSLFPRTGRQHQIRVHCAAIGHALLVDPQYTTRTEFRLSSIKSKYRGAEERPLIGRLTLHASALTFSHPRSGERVTVRAPLPKDMFVLLRQLRKWNM